MLKKFMVLLILERSKLINKLIDLESSLKKPMFLLQNNEFPFYDTSNSNKVFNSISLINLNSIEDFEKRINQKLNFKDLEEIFMLMELMPGKSEIGLEKL